MRAFQTCIGATEQADSREYESGGNEKLTIMKFNQTVKYNLKRVLPILGIAGATLLPACREHRNEPEPQKHSVDLKWFQDYYEEITPENIQKNLDDPTVDTVYLALVNGGDFTNLYKENVEFMRENSLGPRIEMGKGRVRGKGNFVFYPGRVAPADSLWLVQQGWTVNQAE